MTRSPLRVSRARRSGRLSNDIGCALKGQGISELEKPASHGFQQDCG